MNRKSWWTGGGTGLWILIFGLILAIGLGACQTSPQVKEQAMTHMRLGDSLLQEGKPTPALGELLKAVELDPENPVIRNVLGVVYLEKGMFPQAIGSFKKSLELDPKYADVYNNLGTAYLRSGRVTEAIAEFTRAVDSPLYSTPHFAYFNLGQGYLALQDYQKARLNFAEAVKLSPSTVWPTMDWAGSGKPSATWRKPPRPSKKPLNTPPVMSRPITIWARS